MSHQGNQQLPSKEANYLRQIVKFYELKQYKKGIKTADQILKKFPEHGETLALKGLILNCLDKKKEAYDHVTRGLRSDVKSHVCWHVYGLLHRSDRDYKKAISCYTNALKHDKDNIQILRDLALLQIQMRDLVGFLDTRYRLLQLRPGNRNNWIAFSAGHYLNKNYEVAVQVLTAYEGTLEDIPKEEAYEHSELLMFKCKVLEEMQKYDDALNLLQTSKSMIKDRLGVLETEARLYTSTNQTERAQSHYRMLVDIMPDNYEYHQGLRSSFGIDHAFDQSPSEETLRRLEEMYQEFAEKHPYSDTCRRIPLDFKEGDAFVEAAREYVKTFLLKGIPSLFSDLKPLYSNQEKALALQNLFEGLSETLEQSNGDADPVLKSNPQCMLWIHHYLAQHYDVMGDTELALKHVDAAIEHTPTVSEVYDVQSKILKHAGDLPGAFMAADLGRKLDLADRYLNSIAVKACFRAGRIEEADDLAALFTKDEDQLINLVEMQCLWYEISCGDAHFRKRNFGKALKKYIAVGKHFDDFVDDQFDFHGYCIRKMTLRAYIDMLHMEDKIYNEASYAKAAGGAIRCYLSLHDDESLRQRPNQDTPEVDPDLKPKEKKKENPNAHKKGQPPPVKEDPDPDGVELASASSPLNEATKFVTMLRSYASEKLDSQALGFEVYFRKERMLLALSCVQRAMKIAGRKHPTVHSMIIRLCKTVSEKKDKTEVEDVSPAGQILSEGISELLQGKTVQQYNQHYLETEADSGIVHRAVAVEMLVILDPEHKQQHMAYLMKGTRERPSLKECEQVHRMLLGPVLQSVDVAEEWKRRCAEWYPRSSYFDGPLMTHITEPEKPNEKLKDPPKSAE